MNRSLCSTCSLSSLFLFHELSFQKLGIFCTSHTVCMWEKGEGGREKEGEERETRCSLNWDTGWEGLFSSICKTYIYTCTARPDTRMDAHKLCIPYTPFHTYVCDKTGPHLYCMLHEQVSGIGLTAVMY